MLIRLLIFGLFFVGVGTIIYCLIRILRQKNRGRRCTCYAKGTIISVDIRSSNSEYDNSNSFIPTVEFYVNSDESIAQEKITRRYRPLYSSVPYGIGQSVTVLYNNDNYNDFYLELDDSKSENVGLIVAAIAFIFFGLFLLNKFYS